MKGDPVAANLKLAGGMRGDHWRGALSELKLKTPLRRWDLTSPWDLDVDLPRQRVAMGDLCLGSQGASLCVKRSQVSAAQGSLEFALAGFDLKRLRPWLPDNFSWQAVLSADGRASWRGNQPTLHAVVRTTPGTFVTDDLKTDYQQLALGLDFERQQAAIRLDFASRQIGNIDTELLIRSLPVAVCSAASSSLMISSSTPLPRSFPKCAPCTGLSRPMPVLMALWRRRCCLASSI